MTLTPFPAQASSTIAAGKDKYKGGDRMGALKLFEDAVTQVGQILQQESSQCSAAHDHGIGCSLAVHIYMWAVSQDFLRDISFCFHTLPV